MGFSQFWEIWPRKDRKIPAEKAYAQQIRKGYTDDELMAGCRAFAQLCKQRGTDRSFIPLAASWLRAGGWQDEELRPFASAVTDHGEKHDAGLAAVYPEKYRAMRSYLSGCTFQGDTLTVPNAARKSLIWTKYGCIFPDLQIEVAP